MFFSVSKNAGSYYTVEMAYCCISAQSVEKEDYGKSVYEKQLHVLQIDSYA